MTQFNLVKYKFLNKTMLHIYLYNFQIQSEAMHNMTAHQLP